MNNSPNIILNKNLYPNIDYHDYSYFYHKVNSSNMVNSILEELAIDDNKDYYKTLLDKHVSYIENLKYNVDNSIIEEEYPHFNLKDIFNYIIILGCPFVPVEKHELFKKFLKTKSVLENYSSYVKDIILPYTNEDNNNPDKQGEISVVIVKFDSIEIAQLAKSNIDGKIMTKQNKLTVLTMSEYLQLDLNEDENVNHNSNLNNIDIDNRQNYKTTDLQNLKNNLTTSLDWEKTSLEEQFAILGINGIQLYSFYYFKQQTYKIGDLYENSLEGNSFYKFSPNGTYLVKNSGTKLEFFTFNKGAEYAFEIAENCHFYSISPDEKSLITYIGLGNTNLITDFDYIKDLSTRHNIFLWDLRKREIIKSIKINHNEKFENFKWSETGNYLARLKGETLIIYETPDFKMQLDKDVNLRQPLTDKVTSYDWFPNKDFLMTIFEKKNHKQLDTTINFYYVPNRIQCKFSIPLRNFVIQEYKWHPNGKAIAFLLKSINSFQWIVKLVEFDLVNFTHKGSTINVIEPLENKSSEAPIVDYYNDDSQMAAIKYAKDMDYIDAELYWINDGNNLMIVGKKEIRYSYFQKDRFNDKYDKWVNNYDGDTISLFMYNYSSKTSKLKIWEKENLLIDVAFCNIIVSPNQKILVLCNNRFSSPNSYGDCSIYAVYNDKIEYSSKISFGNYFNKIEFDNSGRYLCSSINKINLSKSSYKDAEVNFHIMDLSGESIKQLFFTGKTDVNNLILLFNIIK